MDLQPSSERLRASDTWDTRVEGHDGAGNIRHVQIANGMRRSKLVVGFNSR